MCIMNKNRSESEEATNSHLLALIQSNTLKLLLFSLSLAGGPPHPFLLPFFPSSANECCIDWRKH